MSILTIANTHSSFSLLNLLLLRNILFTTELLINKHNLFIILLLLLSFIFCNKSIVVVL